MNAAHLHLLLNHLPIVGTLLALPLLLLAIGWRKQPAVLGAAVLILAFSAAGAVGANLTGEGAEERVEHMAGVSERTIHEHEERAETATVVSVVTGIAGLGLLGWAARRKEASPLAMGALLILTGISAGTMAWTGASGGRIHHPEVRADGGVEAQPLSKREADPGLWGDGDDDDD